MATDGRRIVSKPANWFDFCQDEGGIDLRTRWLLGLTCRNVSGQG